MKLHVDFDFENGLVKVSNNGEETTTKLDLNDRINKFWKYVFVKIPNVGGKTIHVTWSSWWNYEQFVTVEYHIPPCCKSGLGKWQELERYAIINKPSGNIYTRDIRKSGRSNMEVTFNIIRDPDWNLDWNNRGFIESN